MLEKIYLVFAPVSLIVCLFSYKLVAISDALVKHYENTLFKNKRSPKHFSYFNRISLNLSTFQNFEFNFNLLPNMLLNIILVLTIFYIDKSIFYFICNIYYLNFIFLA